MNKETVGEALGLSKQRDDEIMRLARKIALKSRTKAETIRRLEKQGLERKELILAVFYAGVYTEAEEHYYVDKLAELNSLDKLVKNLGRPRIRMKKIVIEKLTLPDGRCICDDCPDRGNCSDEEEKRARYERIKKRNLFKGFVDLKRMAEEEKKKAEPEKKKKKKAEKGYKVKIE